MVSSFYFFQSSITSVSTLSSRIVLQLGMLTKYTKLQLKQWPLTERISPLLKPTSVCFNLQSVSIFKPAHLTIDLYIALDPVLKSCGAGDTITSTYKLINMYHNLKTLSLK